MSEQLPKQNLGAEEYLRYAYAVPKAWPTLPLPDEPFVLQWEECGGREALVFLEQRFSLACGRFSFARPKSVTISFAHTLGGKLPVVSVGCHEDFRAMEALLNGRDERRELPRTVNAFAMRTRAEAIFRHSVLLLNRAPYSNIPAEKLGLGVEDWLERSHRLRFAHECAHYETLRLLGSMKNHALDEILADALGQIAAFGNFDADRQRLFFGLAKGESTCTGRLAFYCQNVALEERPKVYRAVNRVLDDVAEEANALLAARASRQDMFGALVGRSIAARLLCRE